MQRLCRKTTTPIWRRRQWAMTELLRRARVVTDPKKLALNAKVATRKAGTESNSLLDKCELPLQESRTVVAFSHSMRLCKL